MDVNLLQAWNEVTNKKHPNECDEKNLKIRNTCVNRPCQHVLSELLYPNRSKPSNLNYNKIK